MAAQQEFAALSDEAQSMYRQGQLDDAIACCDRALALRPDHATSWFLRGAVNSRQGNRDTALADYSRAVALKPNFAEAWSNLGMLLHELGRLNEALANLDRAVDCAPRNAALWHNRAFILADLGRLADAVACFDHAIILQPDLARLRLGRGNLLERLGRTRHALHDYDRAAQLDRGLPGAWTGRGRMQLALDLPAEALMSFDHALALSPPHVNADHWADVWADRAMALQQLQRVDDAVASSNQAVAIAPRNTGTWIRHGNLLDDVGQLEAALAAYDRALEINPGAAEIWSDRGVTLRGLLRIHEAIANFDRAIALDPTYISAYWNKSLALLLLGPSEEGWRLFEYRWRRGALAASKREFAQQPWLGNAPLAGKTLLLHAEQGFGDTIQFCRFARLASDSGARVILEAQRELAPLLTSLPGVARVIAKGDPLPPFDLHCPLMSLPLAFRTTLNSIPAAHSYLHADPGRIKVWTQHLGPRTRPRVGVVWQGNSRHPNDGNRSVPLELLLTYLPLSAEYVCLQKDVRASDRAIVNHSAHTVRFIDDRLDDFADTAALCHLMDVVLSIDTAVAHLAAALGCETRILLPYAPDWRWLLDRTDSPWYPTVRLFRQHDRAQWDSPLDRLRSDLNSKFGVT